MDDPITFSILGTIFLSAFFDATLVTCFFVFGEAAFLLAGGLAYSSGSIFPILAAYIGAYAADQSGYSIGRFNQRIFKRITLVTLRRRKIVRRAKSLIIKRGVITIIISRFAGPIAWITPPLAGSLVMSYPKFAVGSLIGVVLGVGQFLALGWILSFAADTNGFDPQAFLTEHFWVLFFVGQGFLLALMLIWRFGRRLNRHG